MREKTKEIVGLGEKVVKLAKSEKPSKSEIRKLYVVKSKSIREVAEILGCTKDMVYRALKEYGIETRANRRRSKLRNMKQSVLERGIKRLGIRGYARELGVDESTLRHHLKVRKD